MLWSLYTVVEISLSCLHVCFFFVFRRIPKSLEEAGDHFLSAAQMGMLDIVEKLHGVFGNDILEFRDSDGYSALHRSSYNGHLPVVEYLLTVGAKIDMRTGDGWQPIHCACRWNKVEVASILLQNGAVVNSQTNGGQTPLHLASCNDIAIATLECLLLHPDLDPSLVNNKGETAFDLASTLTRNAYLFELVDESILNVR